MNYENMSDDEIAVRVLHFNGFKSVDFGDGYEILIGADLRKDVGPKSTKKFRFDPCNNPSDAWPIIMENFISIDQHYNGSYIMVCGYSDVGLITMQCLRKDVLRAAMIVFLKTQEAKRG